MESRPEHRKVARLLGAWGRQWRTSAQLYWIQEAPIASHSRRTPIAGACLAFLPALGHPRVRVATA